MNQFSLPAGAGDALSIGQAARRPTRYDPLSRFLHWIFAAAIIYLTSSGLARHFIRDAALLEFLSQFNASLGTCLAALFPLRFLWQFFRPEPEPLQTISALQHGAAHVVHALLYALIAVVLVSGIVMVPDGYWFFGLFYIRTPFAQGALSEHWMLIHRHASYALGMLVLLHVSAVVLHRLLKNRVLERML